MSPCSFCETVPHAPRLYYVLEEILTAYMYFHFTTAIYLKKCVFYIGGIDIIAPRRSVSYIE